MGGLVLQPHRFTPAEFSPASIAGLKLWYEADKITGLSDGDPVITWVDSSTSGKTLSATANGTYKTGILNGKPVVRCATTDLRAASAVTFKTALVVAKYNAATFASYAGLLTGTTLDGPNVVLVGWNGTSNFFDQALGVTYRKGGGSAISPFAAPMNAFAICQISLSGGWNITPDVADDRATGAGYWSGDIAAIIAYDTVLSLANLDLVGGYLADKYALTWAAAA